MRVRSRRDGTNMTAESIQIRDVHKRFGQLEVLRGIDIDIGSGKTVALFRCTQSVLWPR